MITKLLIANRGEIACRIARTCERLGVATVTIHSSSDRKAIHVRTVGESVEVGGGTAAESYLNAGAIIEAARTTGADAIHPGIGFLSEHPEFAREVEAAELVFVGPRSETLERFADKTSAKAEARRLGIPVLGGGEAASADRGELLELSRALSTPFLLKAVAGGGGRGIRIVHDRKDLAEAIDSAMKEATAAFGTPDLMVEEYLAGARHLEVQIAGDGAGNAIHLFERECSLQRRFQKVLEEAPAPRLAEIARKAIRRDALTLAEHARYRGVGTVEFLVCGEDHRFLEVNPRLQVEHPVTEMTTGIDLVEVQLRIAARERLPFAQAQIKQHGHAIEARIYAESPHEDFAPSSGVVHRVEFPRGLRVDSGIAAGEVIPPHYDSMLAKLIASADDREQALLRLRAALPATVILGVETNLPFLQRLLDYPLVRRGRYDLTTIERAAGSLARAAHSTEPIWFAVAGCLALRRQRSGPASDPWTTWDGFTRWRLGRGNPAATGKPCLTVEIGGETREIALGPISRSGEMAVRVDAQEITLALTPLGGDSYHVAIGNTVTVVRAVIEGGTVHLDGAFGPCSARVNNYVEQAGRETVRDHGQVLAPVMGEVTKVNVAIGDRVDSGDVLVVQESMKMELRLTAPCAGIVAALECREGDMVERRRVLVSIHRDGSALRCEEDRQ